jgi:hypothetical protein
MAELYPLLDPYVKTLEAFCRLVCKLWLARVEEQLNQLAEALDAWLNELSANPRRDWQASLEQLLQAQEAEGRQITPDSRKALLDFLGAWSAEVDWTKVGEASQPTQLSDTERSSPQPATVLGSLGKEILGHEAVRRGTVPSHPTATPLGDKRAAARALGTEAEIIVSEAVEIARNVGAGRDTIPGSGPGGIRIPDLRLTGPKGSLRLRGSIIEVKASAQGAAGRLSGRSVQQIRDAGQYALELRQMAKTVDDPALKSILENAHVEVFSDLPQPKGGQLFRQINFKLLRWQQIPRSKSVAARVARRVRSIIPSRSSSAAKPGPGAAANLAVGLLASLAEAGVAESIYQDAHTVLNNLITDISNSDAAQDIDWDVIQRRLREIGEMKQTALGSIAEFFSYGQGSLKELHAMAMMTLADELAAKYGYQKKRAWGDVFHGRFGHFDKQVPSEHEE